MYSQQNEEELIISRLCPNGDKDIEGEWRRFLDIGAYDGKTFSNTLRLVELGWGGLCIEPHPKFYNILKERHAENPKIAALNFALTPETDGNVAFWIVDEAVSTTQIAHRDKWSTMFKFDETKVPCMSVERFFNEHCGPFHFINIDTEGTSFELARIIPFKQLETKLVSVEIDFPHEELDEYMASQGLTYIERRGDNFFWGRD